MAKKTNKTSHVLNLITGSQPPVASSGETQPSSSASGETQQEGSAAEEPVRVPSANVTVVDPREEGKLAEEIQKNLIRELEKEQTEEQAEQPREQEEQSEEQTERSEEQTEQPNEQAEQTQEQTEQPQTNAGTPVQKEPEQQEEQKQEDRPSYRVVNIMEEILTPELILDALKSNDTCTCSRCQADVKALMLTRLPPKYIVADNTAVPMLLTYYHNKFRVAVLSQSIRACMDVKERPRHIL
uniref:late competence development ComFB family protein n=1 Tax=Enterocloster sp. TaxID=2719315 RepID=UPI003FEDCF21